MDAARTRRTCTDSSQVGIYVVRCGMLLAKSALGGGEGNREERGEHYSRGASPLLELHDTILVSMNLNYELQLLIRVSVSLRQRLATQKLQS